MRRVGATGAGGAEGGALGGTGAGGAACAAGGAAGFFSAGAAAGRAGGAAGAVCCLVISFRTSPGLEMWDRSIFVLISSLSARAVRADLAPACDSAVARKWARTFSASCSSIELECVFFSVTPTTGSASRMALLLTSSSLARSLIRILLIRPLFPPPVPLSLHSHLTASLLVPRPPKQTRQNYSSCSAGASSLAASLDSSGD